MNKLNENIAILEAKVKADEVKKIAEEKKEMQEKNDLKKKIRDLKPRIEDLIQLGEKCQELKISFPIKNEMSRFGYDSCFEADETAIFLPEGSGDDWGKIAYAKTEDLPKILNKYPQLTGAVRIEATYQSAERAAMDGYEKIFRKSEGVILYAQEGSNHKTTWAEVVGYGEVY